MPIKKSARLFNCARCHTQTRICSTCDHGNIYCGKRCARASRKNKQNQSAKRYRNTRKGRFSNAARQDRHRKKQQAEKKVTSQSSNVIALTDLLRNVPDQIKKAVKFVPEYDKKIIYCDFCHASTSNFIRLGKIRPRFRSH